MSRVLPTVYVQLSTTATITAAGTTSAAVDLSNNTLTGLFIPAAFTGTTLTFTTSTSLAGTYVPMVDGAGNTVSKTIAQGQFVYLDPNIFAGIRFIKFVSGSTEGSDRILTLSMRPIV